MRDRYILSLLQGATMHTSHSDTSGIARIVERRDEHLWCTLDYLRSRNHLHNLVEKISDIVCRFLPVLAHPSVLCRTIYHGEVQLVLSGVEREHEVEHHLIHLLGAAVRLIHLVHHNNGFESNLQSLLQHETRLRHRALEGIHQQQASVCHIEHTLHLATEVGVSRSINDIDFCSFPIDGDVLREDCDTSLALQVVAIQYLSAEVLSVTEEVAREHHLIHQSRLTMIDVCNNCYVPNILHFFLLYKQSRKPNWSAGLMFFSFLLTYGVREP